MEFLNQGVNYILSFKSYVMLPMLMLILSLVIGMKFFKALKHSITLGIGFIGIFIVFDYFVAKIGPVLEQIIKRTGMQRTVLDVGWPPMAAIAWGFKLAPLLIIVIMLINIVMLAFKLTKTINIDIWNYWHFIFTAQLVYSATNNLILAVAAAIFVCIVCIKLADWSVIRFKNFSGMPGISCTTLSGVAYYPFTIMVDKIIDKIPGLNKVEADTEAIKKKLGFFGEGMTIGFIMGLVLGVVGGYAFKDILELAFNIAAVVFILPKMTGILGEGLIPISDGMKKYMLKKFPDMKDCCIGMDLAVVQGNPAVIVTGILLMPIALILALILPGINFIPLGDLPNTIGAAAIIVVAARGNVIRAVIAGIPIIIGKLYAASSMAATYTNLAKEVNFKVSGYSGSITGFLDGGNLLRFWTAKLFSGNLWAFIIIPVFIYFMILSKKTYESEQKESQA